MALAIYHLSTKPISRSSGRSAVGAAAYRAGAQLTNERDGLTHDYRRKQGIEHSEIVLPEGVSANWVSDRETLWNAAELAENRKDARVAREFEIALPHELTTEQHVALTREFSQDLADRFGGAVDFAIHSPHSASDVRNHHAHIMMTTRVVAEGGLGDKTSMERENKWLLNNDMATTQMQLRDVRLVWEQTANAHLARAGHEVCIDHRSHQDRGLEIEPTQHVGVHATQMDRRGLSVDRQRQEVDAAKRNAKLINKHPEHALKLVTGEKSVFDRHDVARTLHRYIDDPETFQHAFAKVMASQVLVELQAEQTGENGERELARYSTREMVDVETGMAESADSMSYARSHSVSNQRARQAIDRQDQAIRRSVAHDVASQVSNGEMDASEGDQKIASAGLSDEQCGAVRHITGPAQLSVVVGHAGAGKSTMLAAAREAWEAQGYRVHGAALAGKAAEGLEESSGIESRTLASWEYGWQSGKGQLGSGDVFVIDEAGMVGSRQMARFVDEAERSGAKLVLVGDHEQLQAIGAGAPFRTIADRVGSAELQEIRRQRVDWQQKASIDFASQRTNDGLAAYNDRGSVRFVDSVQNVRNEIVSDYLADWEARPDGNRLAMAHRRVDVRALNEDIRAERQQCGDLAKGVEAGEVAYKTNEGERSFAVGDRIVFLENNKDLGVKNGMLGTVEAVEQGRITAELDDKGRSVRVSTHDYCAIDHGYAVTIHKTQGATCDRSFVMASQTMDRHLTYVAMTRHKDDVQLYAALGEFTDRRAGQLVEHGVAPFENRPEGRDSYFVTLEADSGRKHTIWGVDLQRAMAAAAPKQGDKIGLQHTGSETVRLPDGQTAERNVWSIQSTAEMAFERLQDRLSRSGAKESTLDYGADRLEVMEKSRAPHSDSGRLSERGPEREQDRAEEQGLGRTSPVGGSESPENRDVDNMSRGPTARSPQEPERVTRNAFSGLKLNKAREPDVTTGRRSEDRALHMSTDLEKSLDRYAKAYNAADKMRREHLPVLDSQKQELTRASQQLDRAQPGTSQLMQSTLQHDAHARQAMRKMSGKERVGELRKSMKREEGLQADPQVRAERAIEKWQTLDQQRKQLSLTKSDGKALGQVQGDMRALSDSVKNDPAMEKAMRGMTKELGVTPSGPDQNMGQAMDKSISKGKGLWLGR